MVSLYLDGKIHDFPNKFKELIKKKGDCDIIIGTDSNSHSSEWNCSSTDSRGELLEQFLIDNNLTCLNVGNNPTFQNGSGNTSIIQVCNKTQSVIVNGIIGYNRYRAQSTLEEQGKPVIQQTKARVFLENGNRNLLIF